MPKPRFKVTPVTTAQGHAYGVFRSGSAELTELLTHQSHALHVAHSLDVAEDANLGRLYPVTLIRRQAVFGKRH